MSNELFDVVDENGVITGQVLSRDEVHKKGIWHSAVGLAIINDKDEILLQQRTPDKEKNPNMWDLSVAGHISSTETPLDTVEKETEEELGLTVDREKFMHIGRIKQEQVFSENFIERQHYDIYVLELNDLKIEDIKIQESEVQDIKFVPFSQFLDMVKNNQIVEREKTYKLLFEYLLNKKEMPNTDKKSLKEADDKER